MTVSSMQKLLTRLDATLETQEPPLKATWGKPSTEEAIAKAEAKLKIQFPKDLCLFLLCANGQKSPDGFYPSGDMIVPRIRLRRGSDGFSAWGLFLRLNQIVSLTKYVQEEELYPEEEQRKIFGPTTAHNQYIVLTTADDPLSLALDLKPAKGGRIGQVLSIHDQPDYTSVVAPSLSAYLRMMIEGYQQKRFFDSGYGFMTEK